MAANSLGIGLLCVLLLGDVLQDQVSLIHQVHGVKQPRYEVEHLIYPLSSLVSWALSLLLMLSRHIDIWQTLVRWQNLEARLGCLWDFPSWASLMFSSTSHALPKIFFSSHIAKKKEEIEFVLCVNVAQFWIYPNSNISKKIFAKRYSWVNLVSPKKWGA